MALLFLSSLPTITPIPPPPPLPPPDSSLSCESQGFSTSAGTTRTLHNATIKLLSSDASLCFCIYFLRSFLLRSLPQLFLLSFVLDFIAPLFPCALQLSGSLFTPGQTLKDQWMSISHPLPLRCTPLHTCTHTHTHAHTHTRTYAHTRCWYASEHMKPDNDYPGRTWLIL